MKNDAVDTHPVEDHRPWGFFEVLSDGEDHKVKRITVYAGKRLSYQRHRHRAAGRRFRPDLKKTVSC
jgi:mannose-6-phosphate isomerase-like protein (cupin superfamily)